LLAGRAWFTSAEMKLFLFSTTLTEPLASFGLLVLRLGGAGSLLFGHGTMWLQDPMGLIQAAAAVSVLCGAGTRVGALIILLLQSVALLTEPRLQSLPYGGTWKEVIVLSLTIFGAVLCLGAGRWSVDSIMASRSSASPVAE
jgi:uncharacterized membrane protein YphA (DoxX/SURF4 family)